MEVVAPRLSRAAPLVVLLSWCSLVLAPQLATPAASDARLRGWELPGYHPQAWELHALQRTPEDPRGAPQPQPPPSNGSMGC